MLAAVVAGGFDAEERRVRSGHWRAVNSPRLGSRCTPRSVRREPPAMLAREAMSHHGIYVQRPKARSILKKRKYRRRTLSFGKRSSLLSRASRVCAAIGVWRTWTEGSRVRRHEVGKKSLRRGGRYELDRDASRGRLCSALGWLGVSKRGSRQWGIDGREGSPDTESSRIRRPFGRTGAISRYNTVHARPSRQKKPRRPPEARAYCFWSQKSRSDGASLLFEMTHAGDLPPVIWEAISSWKGGEDREEKRAAYIPTSANNGARGHCSNPTGRRTIRSLPSSPIDMPMIALWIQIHGGRAGLIAQRKETTPRLNAYGVSLKFGAIGLAVYGIRRQQGSTHEQDGADILSRWCFVAKEIHSQKAEDDDDEA
ncbi:hypothetical protein B0H11DRAFT_2243207 [Mycena galericulata]|nr:hypothetical protein B0H11DRAFT_2243207 [Mycena galericulata]